VRKRRRRSTGSEGVAVALILGVIILSLILSISAVIAVWRLKVDIIRLERKTVGRLEKRIENLENLLGPDSPLSEYIVNVNYVTNMLRDFRTIEKALAENVEDIRSAYFRILVIGEERVWISIKKDGKTYFADNCLPGLLPYKFYYFKPPNVKLDYVKVVPSDAGITVGKPNRVFLIFFGVGSGGSRPSSRPGSPRGRLKRPGWLLHVP